MKQAAWLLVLTLVACKVECDEDEDGLSRQRRNEVICTSDGCGSQDVDFTTTEPSHELTTAIKYNGPEVPLTLGAGAYDAYVTATEARAKGPFTAVAGPAVVHASARGASAEFLVVLAPVPNLSLMARDSEWKPRLRVTSITDKSGAELIDFKDTFASDPFFERLSLSEEKPVFLSAAEYEIRIRAPQVPRSLALLYATRSIKLTREATLADIAKIEGELVLKLPVGARVTHHTAPSFSFADGATTITGAIANDSDITLTISGEDHMRYVHYRALTATGDAAEETEMSAGTEVDPPRNVIRASYADPVAAMRITLADSILTRDLPFELKP